LTNYCNGQVAAGHQVELWTLEGFPHTSSAIRLPAPVAMHVFKVDAPVRLGGSALMRKQFQQAGPADVYHLHGAWLRAMHYGAGAAKQNRRPYILEIMGMFEPWALDQKWLQKRLARWWYQDGILHGAACLHVNSHEEAGYIRALGFKTPIAVVPVGVDISKIGKDEPVKAGSLPQDLKGRPFVLYLSRLHPKKGLDLLIRSWAKIKRPDWMLVIAGTGDHNYVGECRQLADQLGVANQCLWLGHVDELLKSRLFTNAHCYVLPTSSENFGNAVAEALAHKTPVITTRYTPWKDLPKHGCGWVIDNTESELCSALNEAIQMDAPTRQAMGIIGETLVRDHYSLELVCKDILAVYEWVLGSRSKPECVV